MCWAACDASSYERSSENLCDNNASGLFSLSHFPFFGGATCSPSRACHPARVWKATSCVAQVSVMAPPLAASLQAFAPAAAVTRRAARGAGVRSLVASRHSARVCARMKDTSCRGARAACCSALLLPGPWSDVTESHHSSRCGVLCCIGCGRLTRRFTPQTRLVGRRSLLRVSWGQPAGFMPRQLQALSSSRRRLLRPQLQLQRQRARCVARWTCVPALPSTLHGQPEGGVRTPAKLY